MPHLAELVANAKAAVEDAQDVAALDLVRVEYFGKKGHFTLQMQSLRDVPAEDRPAAGAVINQAKQEVQDALNARKNALESAALNARRRLKPSTCPCRAVAWRTVACIR